VLYPEVLRTVEWIECLVTEQPAQTAAPVKITLRKAR
jgi:hypothetical protein